MPEINNKKSMIEILKLRKRMKTPTWITICGESMYPLIPNASKVLINPLVGELKEGMILVFEVEDNLLIHRLIGQITEADKVKCQTKGDNVFYRDIIIEDSNIMGYVEKIKRGEDKKDISVYPSTRLSRLISWISNNENKIHTLTYSCSEKKKPFINAVKYNFKLVIWLLSYAELLAFKYRK